MAGGLARATVHDVAARAGVSIATVSRVLTGSRPVTPSLHDRVLAAAEELGYSTNLLGRALRQGRSHSLGLVVPDLENPFFAALAQQASRSFSRSDTDVHICSADNDLELERRAIQSFLGRQVDAIVLIPCDETASAGSVRLADQAVVTIQLDRFTKAVRTHYVGCDNRRGMNLLVEHVLAATDLDHQPVVFVGAKPTSSTAHERLDAFSQAFPQAERMLGSFSFQTGRQAMDELVARGVRSATVMAGADIIALGVLASAQHHGFSVPGDFRVTGFDDLGVSDLAHPALTTVRQPVAQMTDAIVKIVSDHLDGGRRQGLVITQFRPTLVVRESSPAAGATPAHRRRAAGSATDDRDHEAEGVGFEPTRSVSS